MISLSHIQKQYGKQVLFIDAAFQLNPGEKVGLVGPNGAGKTTLFRLIIGEETADEGEVSGFALSPMRPDGKGARKVRNLLIQRKRPWSWGRWRSWAPSWSDDWRLYRGRCG